MTLQEKKGGVPIAALYSLGWLCIACQSMKFTGVYEMKLTWCSLLVMTFTALLAIVYRRVELRHNLS